MLYRNSDGLTAKLKILPSVRKLDFATPVRGKTYSVLVLSIIRKSELQGNEYWILIKK